MLRPKTVRAMNRSIFIAFALLAVGCADNFAL